MWCNRAGRGRDMADLQDSGSAKMRFYFSVQKNLGEIFLHVNFSYVCQARLANRMFSTARSFVCYQTRKYDILKIIKPILTQIGVSGPLVKGMKRSTVGVRRSKVKVTQGRNRSHREKPTRPNDSSAGTPNLTSTSCDPAGRQS